MRDYCSDVQLYGNYSFSIFAFLQNLFMFVCYTPKQFAKLCRSVTLSGNLVTRVFRLFGQQLVARRDSGELERVSPSDQSLAKEPEESGYKIVWLDSRL